MNNLERYFRGNIDFKNTVVKAASYFDGAPDSPSAIFDWLLEDVGGPWPESCDPEQCPYVADLFDEIKAELDKKGDGALKLAVWEPGTFAFAANRIRDNANRLLDKRRQA